MITTKDLIPLVNVYRTEEYKIPDTTVLIWKHPYGNKWYIGRDAHGEEEEYPLLQSALDAYNKENL